MHGPTAVNMSVATCIPAGDFIPPSTDVPLSFVLRRLSVHHYNAIL